MFALVRRPTLGCPTRKNVFGDGKFFEKSLATRNEVLQNLGAIRRVFERAQSDFRSSGNPGVGVAAMLGAMPWAGGGVVGSDFAVECDLRVPTWV